MTSDRNQHVVATEEYYSRAFRHFGASARGVDWSTEDSQETRFRQLDKIWESDPLASICDFGCGYGAYAQHLNASVHKGAYLGIDLSQEMIDHARGNFRNQSDIAFAVGHEPEESDFIVASGTFNVITVGTRRDWSMHVWQMIHCMRDRARLGFAFNLILPPTSPEYARETLFWASPAMVIQQLKRTGLGVRVSKDYGLHEATYLVVRKSHE